jgi:hypothetical protein
MENCPNEFEEMKQQKLQFVSINENIIKGL